MHKFFFVILYAAAASACTPATPPDREDNPLDQPPIDSARVESADVPQTGPIKRKYALISTETGQLSASSSPPAS
jgi:hypothetical protein